MTAAGAPLDGESALADARIIVGQLESIARLMRSTAWAHARSLPVPLTAPQLGMLKTLVEDARAGGSGLSVSQLSVRLGLAHSTVSGIVMRLSQRGLVCRGARVEDRRYARVELTAEVTEWLTRELPDERAEVIARALKAAEPQQRDAILSGVRALAELIDAAR